MKTIITVLLLIGLTLSAQAARLFVGGGGFANIQAAVDAAADHDTVFVSSGTWTGNVSINHSVHLIGRGSLIANTKSIIYGQITIGSGGSGSSISGFHIQQTSVANMCIRILESASGIIIDNCRLNIYSAANYAIEIRSGTSSIIIHSSVFQNASRGISIEAPSDVVVENSIFLGITSGIVTNGSNSCVININNCDFSSVQSTFANPLPNTTVANSLFWNCSLPDCGSINLRYNCAYGLSWGSCSALGNFLTDVFPLINNPGASYDPLVHNLNPIVGSSVINAGDPSMMDRDGSRVDIGCTGGLNPFNFSGIPEFPVTTWLNTSTQVYQGQSLSIQAEGIIGD